MSNDDSGTRRQSHEEGGGLHFGDDGGRELKASQRGPNVKANNSTSKAFALEPETDQCKYRCDEAEEQLEEGVELHLAAR